MAARLERAANKHYRSSYSLESIVGCAAPARLASEAPLLHLFRKQFFFRRFLPYACIVDVASSKEGQETIVEDYQPTPSTLFDCRRWLGSLG